MHLSKIPVVESRLFSSLFEHVVFGMHLFILYVSHSPASSVVCHHEECYLLSNG